MLDLPAGREKARRREVCGRCEKDKKGRRQKKPKVKLHYPWSGSIKSQNDRQERGLAEP